MNPSYREYLADSFWWELDGDTVWLRDAYRQPVCYDKASLEAAINNVRNGRGMYASQEAHLRGLRKFELGLATLNGRASP